MIGIASLLMVGDGNPMFPNDSDDGMVAAEAAAVALAVSAVGLPSWRVDAQQRCLRFRRLNPCSSTSKRSAR